MSYITKITRPDGSLWMSPDVTPMNMIDRYEQTFGTGTVIITRVPVGTPCVYFLRRTQAAQVGIKIIDRPRPSQNRFVELLCQSTNNILFSGVLYVFAPMVIDVPRWRFVINNRNGDIVYSAHMRPLEIHEANRPAGNYNPIPIGEPVAALPMPIEWHTNNANARLSYVPIGYGNNLNIDICDIEYTPIDEHELYKTKVMYIKTRIYDL